MTHALRSLLRTPRFTALAVATLALGIGITTAFFSVFDAVLLQPLPYTDADRLVTVLEGQRAPTSPANFLDLQRQADSLVDLTAASPWGAVWSIGADTEQIQGLMATAGLFDLLEAEALHGRRFSARAGDLPDRVVVLSHGLWQRRFAGDVGVLGDVFRLDGEPYTVVGVMPEGFEFPPFWATGAEFWVPHDQEAEMWGRRGARFLRVFGRLAPGATLDSAQAEIDVLAQALTTEYPEENDELAYTVESLQEPVVDGVRPALWTIFGAVGVVALIACANAASLWWTRATVRRRDLGIRRALGAGPRQVLALGLAEGAVLMALATSLGGLLAVWGVDALVAVAPPDVPRLAEIGLDGRALGFATLVAAALLVVFAVLPVRAGRGALRETLAAAGRSGTDLVGERARSWLVAGQIALSMVLLLGAGLMVRSLVHLWTLDPGLRTGGVLTVTLPFDGTPQAEDGAQLPFFELLVDEMRTLPGVESAAVINHLHLGGDIWGLSYEAEGQPIQSPADAPNASQRAVGNGLFEALDIRVLDGRPFDRRDQADTAPVVVVNQTLAERIWPGQSAVGQRIRSLGEGEPWREIIGVVEDVRQWSLTDSVRPEIYFPYSQNPVSWWHQTSLVLTLSEPSGNAMSLLPTVESRLAELAPGVPAARPRTLEQITGQLLWQPRFSATLLGLFGLSAIGLALVGVYGTMAYSVVLRRPELGVRAALGADHGRLLRHLLGRGLRTTLAGLTVGGVAALGLGRFLESQVHGVSIHDPMVWTVTASAVALAAMLAVYAPARRASRQELVDVLRS